MSGQQTKLEGGSNNSSSYIIAELKGLILMGEKVTSDFRLRKCVKKEQQLQLVDRISQLPNEILAYILSFLTLEDAARTSVLSKHWMHTWMSVSSLNFDSAKMWQGIERIDEMVKYQILRESNRLKYVQWVNKVLLSHKPVVLDVFRIRFDLGKSSQNDIDRWLQYAFARRVQRLDLNLLKYGDMPCGELNAYTFPHRLLHLSNGNSSSCGNGINSDASFGFRSLRVLTFNNVNVSGEVLQFFLQNCPFLEYLVVESSGHLKQLEVCGPFLALKHLEIIYCPGLRSLTVRDTNIVSLKVTEGHRLVLKNVSMLVDVFIAGRSYANFIGSAVSWLSCCLSKLEVLTLQITDLQVEHERAKDVALPKLTKLKQLTFVAHAGQDNSLIVFTSLLRASPNLEKFVLKLEWLDDIARKRTESKKGLAFPLRHLKEVELCGYYGRTTEVELVEYFIQNAVALERIIVDPCDRPFFGPRLHKPEEEGIARNLAKQQLEELVPPHIEWVLL